MVMVPPTVRVATLKDLPEVGRLLELQEALDLAEATRVTAAERRYVLVVDAEGGGLAAVAMVSLAGHVTHLNGLAMDARYATSELESRILGVAEALGRAFDCEHLDVPAPHAA